MARSTATGNFATRSNAVTILVLGILSIAVCGVMGPIAWVMGKKELDRIASGEIGHDGYGMTNAGYICGIIGSIILAFTLIWLLLVFGAAVAR